MKQSISRVLCPDPGCPGTGGDHSSRTAVACRLKRPTQGRDGPSLVITAPLLVLLRMGFTELPRSPGELVSSYLAVSPLLP
ncbi:hypothetical protein SCFA_520017 [anaerobic digester metagenome]|uniref:Uncharacterized protein n=1 Tax=anaerobic digester metagenome TaxID=1263854 RepID=A0A485M1Y2_9ZZZZ